MHKAGIEFTIFDQHPGDIVIGGSFVFHWVLNPVSICVCEEGGVKQQFRCRNTFSMLKITFSMLKITFSTLKLTFSTLKIAFSSLKMLFATFSWCILGWRC